jgi:membrane protease YdiL (CAAX protease family)
MQAKAVEGARSAASEPSAGRTPLLFLLLIPVFSLPFYFLERRALLPVGMPFIAVTSLMVFVPAVLAFAFTYKEGGWRAVKDLLARAFDLRRIRPVFWLVPALLLLPVAVHVAYFVSRLLGNDLGELTPLWVDAGPKLLFFVLLLIPFGIAEEVGWVGYAGDPLQQRWGVLGASAIIGLAWAVWHWLPWYRNFGSIGMVFWMTAMDVLLRVLIFWLYNNTRNSIFIAAVFHASFNVAYRAFPDEGRTFDPFAMFLVLAVFTLLVMWIWGPRNLASYRFSATTRA